MSRRIYLAQHYPVLCIDPEVEYRPLALRRRIAGKWNLTGIWSRSLNPHLASPESGGSAYARALSLALG